MGTLSARKRELERVKHLATLGQELQLVQLVVSIGEFRNVRIGTGVRVELTQHLLGVRARVCACAVVGATAIASFVNTATEEP